MELQMEAEVILSWTKSHQSGAIIAGEAFVGQKMTQFG
jgi:hypothetical protein